jgi:NAD-dependent SIR2 family protein deacetylase
MADRAAFIRQIAETFHAAKARGRPAHLLIGAGCSKSAGVPIAGELIARIQKDYAHRCKAKFGEDAPTYGACMKLLTVRERRDLLEGFLKEAKINWAHIAIAKMVHGGFVERVLTVNFDNILARACGLLGQYPAIYDFGAAPTDQTGAIVVPSIVHLHGQGYGVKLMNTSEETAEHAKKSGP